MLWDALKFFEIWVWLTFIGSKLDLDFVQVFSAWDVSKKCAIRIGMSSRLPQNFNSIEWRHWGKINNSIPITVEAWWSEGEGVEESLLTASRRRNSTLAISVATQLGMSGIAQMMKKRMISIMCSRATISSIVWVADISGNMRCTWPLSPISAQFTNIATRPIASIAFWIN